MEILGDMTILIKFAHNNGVRVLFCLEIIIYKLLKYFVIIIIAYYYSEEHMSMEYKKISGVNMSSG